ncbi:hypothetical protein HKCCSP123_02305 [Rhodobacterales bacterium HKCCSP123]|nr:hypothetical protein [Rhodobacterales bacterium HKCCSP123]
MAPKRTASFLLPEWTAAMVETKSSRDLDAMHVTENIGIRAPEALAGGDLSGAVNLHEIFTSPPPHDARGIGLNRAA